ncbi:MAG: response regulator transcription factor [Cohaesibacteraceae bacterium]|nr:response regulator transcription factor [Cohaesibacteraceae bacterium]
MIKVLVVDDHPIVRGGLVRAISQVEDIQVVGEAESGEEAIYLAKKAQPDVVILDVRMSGISGVDAAVIILKSLPGTKIIALSSLVTGDVINSMLDAGAVAFLAKDVSAEIIIDTIRRAYRGEDIALAENMAKDLANAALTLTSKLGEQQQSVLNLMTKGLTNPEIAEQMGFSVPTARYHVSAILRKLDVSNRTEAVAVARREGF